MNRLAPSKNEAPGIDASGHEVVIVDDDEAVLDSFRFMLEAAGLEVATYRSAVTYLDRGAASPCCLILDQNMPCMTGLELAERLRADGIDVRIMLMTAMLSPVIEARAAALGVERVLQKPPPEDDVMRFVAACF
jgi:FixJ family two-component response regulator